MKRSFVIRWLVMSLLVLASLHLPMLCCQSHAATTEADAVVEDCHSNAQEHQTPAPIRGACVDGDCHGCFLKSFVPAPWVVSTVTSPLHYAPMLSAYLMGHSPALLDPPPRHIAVNL